MRGLIRRPRLLAATILAIFWCAGCSSSPTASVSDADVETLLARLRRPTDGSGAWQAEGTGRVLLARGTARMLGDDEGRFRMEVESPVRYARVHDGKTTTIHYPWGTVIDVGGREEEMTLVTTWVINGYWLSPDAPLVIAAGEAGRKGDVVALEVRHRDGHQPFEVRVDTKRNVPVSVRTAGGVPISVFEMDDHHIVNGRPVAGILRVTKSGAAQIELKFDEPTPITPGEDAWSRPEPTARATYDRKAAARLDVRNDGRGFLFVRPAINGKQLGWFLFDTGAPATILGQAAVKRLGLGSVGRTESSGVGGAADVGIHTVDSIRVGPLRVGPAVLASMDVLRLGWRDIPIEGILGCDTIGQAVVEYDVRAGSIVFHDPATYELPAKASWQRIRLNEGKPVVSLRFEEREAEFLVDTAAGGSFSIGKQVVDRFELLKGRDTQSATSSGVGGSVGMRWGKVRWLEFGGKRFENVSTQFAVANQGSYAQPYPDGIVGIDLIDDFRVVFDLAHKRMAFLDRRE